MTVHHTATLSILYGRRAPTRMFGVLSKGKNDKNLDFYHVIGPRRPNNILSEGDYFLPAQNCCGDISVDLVSYPVVCIWCK